MDDTETIQVVTEKDGSIGRGVEQSRAKTYSCHSYKCPRKSFMLC